MRASTRKKRRPRGATVVAGVLFAVGLLVVGAAASSQPVVCGSCHSVQEGSLSKTAHSAVGCYDCHLDDGFWSLPRQKAHELFVMYPGQIVGRERRGPGVRVSRASCSKCHTKDIAGTIEDKGLRIVHEACAPSPTKCDTCHTSVAHPGSVRWPRTVVMDECVACHNDQAVATKCDHCHVGKLETQRLKSGIWQVTHGPNWQVTHGMGNLSSCQTCHLKAKCIKCHNTEMPHPASFMSTHGKQALDKQRAKCSRCHKSKAFCDGCHGMPMPHPKGFLAAHSERAKSRDDPACIKCHRQKDCTNCHVWHTHPGSTDGRLRAILPRAGGGS